MRYMEDLFLTMFPNIRRIEEKYEKNSRINNNISFLCMDVVWMLFDCLRKDIRDIK